MSKHAICSASSSAMWIACPRSARLSAEAPDTGSPYAEEGTRAHALCEYLLKREFGIDADPPDRSDKEMQEYAEGYRDYVMEQVEESDASFIGIEQHLDFSRWVPEGFGTGDCVLISDDLLQIIDFKYGVGILVEAALNTQMMCYALGAFDTFGDLYNIDKIRLTIYQPRRENISVWDTNVDDLLEWADNILAPAARLAFAGEGEFLAGNHCRFCGIKETCRARAEYYTKRMKHEFEDPATLSNDEIALILPKLDGLISWAKDIKAYALQQALDGAAFPGFKVVEGRSVRKYTDEAAVAKAVEDAGFDPYEKKLLGITEMTKLLGKKQFDELLSGLVVKPKGKPVLAASVDKRPEYIHITDNDFEEDK